jgi:hypothetical protein
LKEIQETDKNYMFRTLKKMKNVEAIGYNTCASSDSEVYSIRNERFWKLEGHKEQADRSQHFSKKENRRNPAQLVMTLCNLPFLMLEREEININITKTKLTQKLKCLRSLTPRNLNTNYCLLSLTP